MDIPYPGENEIIKYETSPLGIILADKHIVTVSIKQTTVFDQFIDNRIKDMIIGFRNEVYHSDSVRCSKRLSEVAQIY